MMRCIKDRFSMNPYFICLKVHVIRKMLLPLSYLIMVIMHVIESIKETPQTLPDLYALLWSIVGCALFCTSLVYLLGTMHSF